MRLKIKIACLGALMASTLGAAEVQDPDYAAMFARRSSSGFQQALDVATERLRQNPRDASAAGVQALVYANAVDFLGMTNAEARERQGEALDRAMRLVPENLWVRAAFGRVHLTDDVASAEKVLKACIAEDPRFLECYNLYGDVLRKSNRPAEAGAVYHEALRRWPQDGELIISNAFYLQEVGQIDSARMALEELVRTQPEYARGHWHLAVLLWQTGGDRSVQIEEAKRAMALDPLIFRVKDFVRMLTEGTPLGGGAKP